MVYAGSGFDTWESTEAGFAWDCSWTCVLLLDRNLPPRHWEKLLQDSLLGV